MNIEKALKLKIKHENLHIMGMTGLHPYENKLQNSKFLAFIRILQDVPEQDGFKWLYIPNKYGICNFLGVNIFHHHKAGYRLKFKFAQSI